VGARDATARKGTRQRTPVQIAWQYFSSLYEQNNKSELTFFLQLAFACIFHIKKTVGLHLHATLYNKKCL
jgi:hypothetical protein